MNRFDEKDIGKLINRKPHVLMTNELNSVLMLNEIELNFIFSVNNTKIIVPEACFIQIYVMMKIS